MKSPAIALLFVALATPVAHAVDIADYGACQGNPDDSGRIQSAIDAAWSLDQEVVFSCLAPIHSTVYVQPPASESITLRGLQPGDGIRLAGQVAGTVPSFGPTAMIVQHCDGCVIRDLTFDGAPTPESPSFDANLLAILGSHSATVTQNTFVRGSRLAALLARNNEHNTYSGNVIDGTTSNTRGMWLGNPCEANPQPGSDCYQNPVAGQELYPTITRNIVSNTGHTGIATNTIGALITRNVSTDTGGAGLVLATNDVIHTQDALVDENLFVRNGFHCVQSDGGGARTERVVVTNNVCSEPGEHGVQITRADWWYVAHNRITNANGKGIVVKGANNITLELNDITDTKPEGCRTQTTGIYVLGGAELDERSNCILILNNTVSNSTDSGIVVLTENGAPEQSADTIHVLLNTSTGNAMYGLRLSESGACRTTNVAVGQNTFTPNGLGTISDGTNSTGCGASTCAVSCPAQSSTCDPSGSGLCRDVLPPSCGTQSTGLQFCLDHAALLQCPLGETIEVDSCTCEAIKGGSFCPSVSRTLICR